MINGKTYHMWEGLVAAKNKYIGKKLIERDNLCGEARTTLIDIRLEANGDDSAMIVFEGKKFSDSCDVQHCGIVGHTNPNVLQIYTTFGASWTVGE